MLVSIREKLQCLAFQLPHENDFLQMVPLWLYIWASTLGTMFAKSPKKSPNQLFVYIFSRYVSCLFSTLCSLNDDLWHENSNKMSSLRSHCCKIMRLFVSIYKHCDRLLGTENSYFCGEKEQNERIKASFEKNTTTYSWSSYSGQASMTENINISAK